MTRSKPELTKLFLGLVLSLGATFGMLGTGCGRGLLGKVPGTGGSPGGQDGNVPGASGGATAAGGSGEGGTGAGAAGTTGIAGQGGFVGVTARSWIAAQCARTPASLVPVTSFDPLIPELQGRWASCGSEKLFNRGWPGIEIGTETFRALAWSTTADLLVPQFGENVEGGLGYQQTLGQPAEATFYLDFVEGPTVSTRAFVSIDGPRQLVLGSTSDSGNRYVALPAELTGEGDAGSGGGGGRAGAGGQGGSVGPFDRTWIANQCAQVPASLYRLTSLDPMAPAIAGRWARCGSAGLFNLDWPGVEFSTDSFHFLTYSSNWALVPEYGVGVQGTFIYQQTAGQPVQVTLVLENGSGAALSATTQVSLSSGDPRQLVFDTSTGSHARYLALPAGAFLGPGGGAGGMTGAGGSGGAGASGGGTGGSAPVSCHTNAECPGGSVCFIAAPISDCASSTAGSCVVARGGNCSFDGPCDCLRTGSLDPYNVCGAIDSRLTCGRAAGVACYGCFPSATSQ